MAKKLGQVAEGKLVKIKENGSLVEFYVAKHDYESGLNGPGRTLLVRKDCYDKRKWGFDSGNNDYSSGAIDDWFNNEYKNILPVDIQTAMGTTKFYYTPGNGNLVVTTIERSIFALSMKELGLSDAYANVEGSTLPIASTLKIANFNGGPNPQWTRSTYTKNNYYAWLVDSHGSPAYGSTSNATQGSRPCFTLPSDLYVWSNGTLSRLPVPPPSPVTTPPSIMQGQPINITWSAVEEADSYVLQRKADGGEWEQVYAGAETSYTDTADSWTTVQYQVCGVFGGVNGAFAVSPTIQVLPASALSIGGTDGDLGALTSDVPYSVATNTGKNVTVDIAVNGVNVFHRADATTYTGTLSVLDLPTGMGSIVIAASVQADSGMVTAERKWTYTKPAQPFPASGGVAALTKDGRPLFHQTLAECVRTIGGPWGGDLGKALEKLARAATFSRDANDFYDLWGEVIPTVKYMGEQFYDSAGQVIPAGKIAAVNYTGTGNVRISLTVPAWTKFAIILSDEPSSFVRLIDVLSEVNIRLHSSGQVNENRNTFSYDNDKLTMGWTENSPSNATNVQNKKYVCYCFGF